MRVIRLTLGLAAGLLSGQMPATAQQQRPSPSFDCAKASLPAERAICASPELAAADRRIASRFAWLLKRLDARAADALREDQRAFLALRDDVYEPDARGRERLAAHLRARRELLEGIVIPSASDRSAEGRWRNLHGMVEIQRWPQGGLSFYANTVEPVRGRWLCEVTGEIREGFVDAGPDMMIEPRRDGATLVVKELPLPGKRVTPGYCGLNGFVEGTYFRWRQPRERGTE